MVGIRLDAAAQHLRVRRQGGSYFCRLPGPQELADSGTSNRVCVVTVSHIPVKVAEKYFDTAVAHRDERDTASRGVVCAPCDCLAVDVWV